MMSFQNVTPEEFFSSADRDNSGKISTDELKLSLKAWALSDLAIENLYKVLDLNSDGEVSKQEFLDAMSQTKMTKEKAIEAFKLIDGDNSGKLTAKELQDAMKEVDVELNLELAERVVCECDKDGDGKIDYNEYLNYLYP